MSDSKLAPDRLVVGVSGASGIIYAERLLQILREQKIESHLVMSRAALQTLKFERDQSPDQFRALADVVYSNADIGASISSGSFRTMGMIVAPCSIKTLSEIATGVTDNLLSRAADVVLKERRRLVLLVRETPLHLGHIRAMAAATEAGAIIMPPVPAFYTRPQTIEDIVDHTVGRALDLFGIESGIVKRWAESAA